MTKEEILSMPAGPEMDALVSRQVMADIPGQAMVREYSTDIAAAWEVVRQVGGGDVWEIETSSEGTRVRLVERAAIFGGEIPDVFIEGPDQEPLAICRAALLATAD